MKLLIEYAKTFLGINYLWGGNTPMGGMDCSGFIQEVLVSVNMDPPGRQNAQQLYDHFSMRAVSSGNMEAGALVFYGKSRDEVSHVAMLINPHQVIEAGGGGGNVRDVSSAIKEQAFIRIRPFGHRKDVIDILLPNYPDWVKNG